MQRQVTDTRREKILLEISNNISKLSGVVSTSGSGGGSVSDATTTSKGILQLSGDLGGTASNPKVIGLANKVDIVTGKGLSTNDFTNDYKTKLDGLNNYTLPAATSTTLGGVKIWNGTQAQYDAITTKDSQTLYFING